MKSIKRCFLVFIFAVLMVSCFSFSTISPVSASVKAQSNSYYLSENSKVDTIHATTVGAMPCIGEARILVFYVDYKDCEPLLTKTKEEVEDMFFSEEGKHDPSLAYTDKDSLRSYYYRSSYGKLDITGSVFEYQTQNSIEDYNNLDSVLNEIIEFYKDSINWDNYDGNNDGYIDGIYILSKYMSSWADANWVQEYRNTAGNKKISLACLLLIDDVPTIAHETCHMLGMPDMYANINMNNGGLWTASIMDQGHGDLPSPVKFVLGWLDNVTFVNSDNVGSFDLRSYSNFGDVLIIYPNGDKENRNWFFVEYVTKEGNNNNSQISFVGSPDKYGIRVWKTQIMLDADFNVIGASELPDGFIPSPFEYLEAIHPDRIMNYYFQVGDKITPYTYPSTAYSDTFYSENDNKFLKDLTFSGVNVLFESLENKVATVEVKIEKEPDPTIVANANLMPLPPNEACDYLDNDDYISFGVLSSNIELKNDESIIKATIKSNRANKEFEVITKLDNNKKNIQLFVTVDILNLLLKETDWTVSFSDIITYYGSQVNINNYEVAFDFSDYPLPLTSTQEQFNTDFNITIDNACNTDIKYFQLSDSTLLTIYFDDIAKKLYWGEINIETNTTKKYELQLPTNLNADELWDNIHYYNKPIIKWEDYGKYFVYIENFICCYSNKELITYFDLSNIDNANMVFVGSNNNSIFLNWSNNKAYKMLLIDNEIKFDSINYDIRSLVDELYEISNIYSYTKDQYIVVSRKTIYFIDAQKNIVKKYENAQKEDFSAVDVCFSNNNYYIFSSSVDLTMCRFDTDFNLVNQTAVLNNLSSTMNELYWINVDFNNNSWIIHFECGSKLNPIGMNTYLIVCDSFGKVINYNKYYDAFDVRPDAHIIPLSENKLIGIDLYSFKHLNIGCGNHSFTDWLELVEPSCTKEGLARRDCNNCEYYQIKEIPAIGHNLSDWSEILAPTCTENGKEIRDCSKCDHSETKDIPKLEHDFGDWVQTLAPTCMENGKEIRDCSRCDHFETKDIQKLGHNDIDNDKICDLCGLKVSKLSIGAIVGIVIGSVAVAGLLGFLVFWFVIKKKQ